MATIGLVDTTLRDGNQSLWGATALTTAMMLGIAPVMDRVGFTAIDFTSSTHMAVAVRWHKENPWERIRLMRAAMPDTPLQFLSTGMRFISWEQANEEVMALAFGLLVEAGIRRFAILEPMNDMPALITACRLVHRQGARDILAALVFTESPHHDDAFYAGKAAELAAASVVTRIYLKDPGGLLTPERAATLIPAIKAEIGDKPLELHSHCTIALAPFSYLVGADSGIADLHVGVGPAASGTAQPEARRTTDNLRHGGHTVDIDDAALDRMAEYFHRLARAEGLKEGAPREFDPSYFRHQVPGGMMATLARQMNEIGRPELLSQVLEEIALVRAELGYPIMVTPFSQIVAAQAVVNVTAKERYASLPDEVIRYVLGRFGRPAGEVDAEVLDRIHANPRTKELAAQPGMPPLAELRRRIGGDISDEELVLRAVMPREQIDAMLAAPQRLNYNPSISPIMALLEGLSDRQPIHRVVISKPGFSLKLTKHAGQEGSV